MSNNYLGDSKFVIRKYVRILRRNYIYAYQQMRLFICLFFQSEESFIAESFVFSMGHKH